MIAAQVLYERTGAEHWLDAWSTSADLLWAQWRDDLWLQELSSGSRAHVLGPAHGFAGNVLALARGDLLDADRRAELERRAIATAAKYARRDDGLCQWPPALEPSGAGQAIRTQWCHGAPGIVASLASLAPHDEQLTELLIAGGELTWQAGPLKKGANLCHGTAGNGYAFSEAVRAHRQRTLARTCARVRHARHRTGRAHDSRVRSRPPLALDRRPGHRPLPPQLPHRHGSLPDPRPLLARPRQRARTALASSWAGGGGSCRRARCTRTK